MSSKTKLPDLEDRDRLIRILESSLSVTTAVQFFAWTQGPLQALLPHEILICGHATANQGEFRLRYFSATRYFRQQHFDAACSPGNGLITRAIRKWQQEQAPCLVPPPPGRAPGEPDWPEMLVRLELRNLICHGIRSPHGGVQSWFGFCRVPSPNALTAHLLQLLTPCLATTYARVVAAESEPQAGDLKVRSLLTPREVEVLELVRDGLSNPEIAGRLKLSTMTAKNHVQNIRVKLNSRTRGQAVAEAIRLGLIRPARQDVHGNTE
ncbi:MAG: response regulator transcription factor [Gallionellaceae bacterium]|nr:response regulator transcription factor [Gallionellaceae bacterium]